MQLNDTVSKLGERAAVAQYRPNWALGYLGIPPRTNVNNPYGIWINTFMQMYSYSRDDSECQGQYVYVVENEFTASHPVSCSMGPHPSDSS